MPSGQEARPEPRQTNRAHVVLLVRRAARYGPDGLSRLGMNLHLPRIFCSRVAGHGLKPDTQLGIARAVVDWRSAGS